MEFNEAVKKTISFWESTPQLKTDRDEFISKYHEIFKFENIDDLTENQIRDFFNFKINKHWSSLERNTGNIVKNMDRLKSALKILLDESKQLSDRIKILRDENSPDSEFGKNLGPAYYTPILLVSNIEKYPVVNTTVIKALNQAKLYSEKDFKSKKEWESIPEIQNIIRSKSEEVGLDLWQIDWVWWKCIDQSFMLENKSSLLEHVKNLEPRMKSNYMPIVLKLLLESENLTTTTQKIKEKFNLLNFDREDYPKSGNIDTVRKALQDVVIFPDAVCVTTFDPPTISVLPLAEIFVSPI